MGTVCIHRRISISIRVKTLSASLDRLAHNEDLTLATQTILLYGIVIGCLLKLHTIENGAPTLNCEITRSILNHSIDILLLFHSESSICLSTHRLPCEQHRLCLGLIQLGLMDHETYVIVWLQVFELF